jgi:hypothetical protein
MKRFIVLIFVIVFSVQLGCAQVSVTTDSNNAKKENNERIKNVIYLELGGNGVGYSFNYERRLGGRFWGRIGASYFPDAFLDLATVPLGVSYLFGKNSSFLELGLGTTLAYAESEGLFDSQDEQVFGAALNATIGHRLQPPGSSFFWRIAFTPLFSPVAGKFLPTGGLSLGYSF